MGYTKNTSNKAKKKGFTLVELIVVITILTILATVAFMSFAGYQKNSRDSVRLNDVSVMQSGLELFALKAGEYPEPDNSFEVSYSGGAVWTQGYLDEGVALQLKELPKAPIDPLKDTTYIYSRLNTKKEFEIGAILEGDEMASLPFLDSTYAADANDGATALIKGTYNQKVAVVKTGALTYVLAVPTIIKSDELLDLIDVVEAKDLSYNNQIIGEFDFNSTDSGKIVVYTGSLDSLKTDEGLTAFAEGLQNAYSGTTLAEAPLYENIVTMDTTNQDVVDNIAGNIAQEDLGVNLGIESAGTNYCVFDVSTFPCIFK